MKWNIREWQGCISIPGRKRPHRIISAAEPAFLSCACNRIRLTCDGKLKPCLHSRDEILVRGLKGEALKTALEQAILNKPAQHVNLTYGYVSETDRYMNQIGG